MATLHDQEQYDVIDTDCSAISAIETTQQLAGLLQQIQGPYYITDTVEEPPNLSMWAMMIADDNDLMMKFYDPELLSQTLFQNSQLVDNKSGNNEFIDIAGILKLTQGVEADMDLPASTISVLPITTDDDAVSTAAEEDEIELLGDDGSLKISIENNVSSYMGKDLSSRQYKWVDDSAVDLIALSSSRSQKVPSSTKLRASSIATASKRKRQTAFQNDDEEDSSPAVEDSPRAIEGNILILQSHLHNSAPLRGIKVSEVQKATGKSGNQFYDALRIMEAIGMIVRYSARYVWRGAQKITEMATWIQKKLASRSYDDILHKSTFGRHQDSTIFTTTRQALLAFILNEKIVAGSIISHAELLQAMEMQLKAAEAQNLPQLRSMRTLGCVMRALVALELVRLIPAADYDDNKKCGLSKPSYKWIGPPLHHTITS